MEKIFGKIVNENNEPLEFATVYNVNEKTGTKTNEKGEFSLAVKEGDFTNKIRFSYVGYSTTFKPILGNDFGVIKLKKSGKELKEVVIKGTKLPKPKETGFNYNNILYICLALLALKLLKII